MSDEKPKSPLAAVWGAMLDLGKRLVAAEQKIADLEAKIAASSAGKSATRNSVRPRPTDSRKDAVALYVANYTAGKPGRAP